LQTALGIAIVDESVFALQQQDPGFAKLYFMLERELMAPFYQVKGFELPASVPSSEKEIRLTQDDAAKATWAGLQVPRSQLLNSRELKYAAMYEAQSAGFDAVSNGAVVSLMLVPLALATISIISLLHSDNAKRVLIRLSITLGIVVGFGIFSRWLFVLASMYVEFEGLVFSLFLILGLGVLGFTIYAWAGRDQAAKLLTLLSLAWPILVFLLSLTTDRGGTPLEGLILAAAWLFLLVPVAYLLFGQARWVQKCHVGGGIALGLGSVLTLSIAILLLVSRVQMSPMANEIMPPGAMPEEEMLFGDGVVMDEVGGRGVPKDTGAVEGQEIEKDQASGTDAPRLRQYFPETLYWAPEVVTDGDGFVSLDIPMADSITTWRLTALASSKDGRLGFTTQGVRVFQDFFVDIDLPVSLTQGDEISVPVGVFNYLPKSQKVRLVVQKEDWFELVGDGEQTLTIASNDIEVVYFPIRVIDFGRQGFQVTAWGEEMSDAIRREVAVVPNGKEIRTTTSDWLRESEEIEINVSGDAVPGTPYVEVKVYPGVMAQAVEGLEKILRLPHG
jgi:hypothetical protein